MKARELALGGMLAAAAVMIMTLGGLIPAATYIAPMLASMLLVPLLGKLSKGLCVGWYAVVSLLSVLLCADKETAFVFVFLGWYPIVREPLQKLPGVPRLLLKRVIFNAAAAALYAVLMFVFPIDGLIEEFKELSLVLGAILLLMGNCAFILFDFLLAAQSKYLQMRKKK